MKTVTIIIIMLASQTIIPGFSMSQSVLGQGAIFDMQKNQILINESIRLLLSTTQRYNQQPLTIPLITQTLNNNETINSNIDKVLRSLQEISTITTDNKRHHKRLNAMLKKTEALKNANNILLSKLHEESIPFLENQSHNVQ